MSKSIRSFDNSVLDTNFRHEKQSSLDSNFQIEPSTRISLNSRMLTKVRQLCGNQKLTANCYQKLTANCYQKLTAKCYQKFQSTVDSEMLSKVSVKSRQQKFQSKVDTESFSQKLTAKCNAKIVRDVALRYCKQINNGRYQCNTLPVISPAKKEEGPSQRTIHRRIQLNDAVKNILDYF